MAATELFCAFQIFPVVSFAFQPYCLPDADPEATLMRVKLTPAFVLRAPPPQRGDRIVYWDEALPCFGLMVTKNGHKSFVVQYRANGVSRRLTFKAASRGGLSLEKAKREARAVIGEVTKGGDPLTERRKAASAAENSLQSIAKEFLIREGVRQRSYRQQRQVLERLVYPSLGSRQIDEIRRSDIVRMLDRIADENGPRMADTTLAFIRRIMNWHASRSDDFRSPIVRGMVRTKPSQRRRQRVLTDGELRTIWRTAETKPSAFSRLVQFLLLTAARRNEAARMQLSEVSGSEWIVPPSRYKTGLELLVPLSGAAQAILNKTPRIGTQYGFTYTGKRPLSGLSNLKRAFDAQCGVTEWRLHDLRRTARSLMSRAGVPSDHAERSLGHVMGGIRGTYDRHEYADEKRRAFEALAGLIERIVDPKANVTPLRDTTRSRGRNCN
jgi:integrase